MPPSAMNIMDVEVSSLQVGKPAKVEHSLYGKVRYDNSTRMCVRLENVHVLNHRTMDADLLKYGIIDVAMPRDARRIFADIDDRMISMVIDNIPLWFAKGVVEESTIDDFYKRSIITTKQGPAARFKVQRDACVLAQGAYNLALRCRGLRFFKHVFILEWELISAHPLKVSPVSDLFLEEEPEKDRACDDHVGPTWEETKAVELWESLQGLRETVLSQKSGLECTLSELEGIERDLDGMWPTSHPKMILDSISARLAPLLTRHSLAS